jgi:plasmid stability protein
MISSFVCFHFGSILEAEDLKMATLTIKNIPEKLCTRLKESAAQHRRSINGEAISCLEKVLVGNRVDPHDFLVRARALRERMPRVFLTEKELRAARNQGRP